jgi:hypothetical protein
MTDQNVFTFDHLRQIERIGVNRAARGVDQDFDAAMERIRRTTAQRPEPIPSEKLVENAAKTGAESSEALSSKSKPSTTVGTELDERKILLKSSNQLQFGLDC